MSGKRVYPVAILNDRWRVIDDPLQWILQYRRRKVCAGAKSPKDNIWRGHRFCRTRTALLRDIRENCGEVGPAALAIVKALPEWHVEWAAS